MPNTQPAPTHTTGYVFHRGTSGAEAYARFLSEARAGKHEILTIVQAEDRILVEAITRPDENDAGTVVFLSANY